MHVPQGHIAGSGRERLGAEGVLLDEMGGPLASPQAAAVNEGVGGQDVHRIGLEAGAEDLDQQPHPLGVGLGVLIGRRLHQVLGPHHPPLGHERQQGQPHVLPARHGQPQDAALVGPGRLGHQMHPPGRLEHGGHRAEAAGVVVVAGDHRHLRPGPDHVQQPPINHGLGVGRRAGRVEQVAGQDHQIDGALADQPNNLVDHRPMLISPAVAPDGLPHMPITGMQQPHHLTTSNRRRPRPQP